MGPLHEAFKRRLYKRGTGVELSGYWTLEVPGCWMFEVHCCGSCDSKIRLADFPSDQVRKIARKRAILVEELHGSVVLCACLFNVVMEWDRT